MRTEATARKAAVLGQPVEHSLSPVLHHAAYRALGLTAWEYQRIEVDAAGLPELLHEFGADWVGLSVTMPGKHAALRAAAEVTDRAAVVGAANTLVRTPSGGWLADCTDIDGIAGALRAAAGYAPRVDASGLILGAGGTAAAAVAALPVLGVARADLVVRDPARAGETRDAATRAGVDIAVRRWSEVDFAELARAVALVISTVPAAAVAPHAAELACTPCLLDAIYHPWPTPLADAVAARGGRIGTGLDMLLHQSFGQVEQFTGMAAPRERMRDALCEATGHIPPLPLS